MVSRYNQKCSIRLCLKNSKARSTCNVTGSNVTSYPCCINSPSLSAGSFYKTKEMSTIRGCPFLETQPKSPTTSNTDSSSTDGELDIEELDSAQRLKSRRPKFSLGYLNFSGCYEVTERGLFYLLNEGLLQQLSYLNVSSCFNISGIALNNIVRRCRKLQPENLSYCNAIINGPYPTLANGCDNMYHPIKVCCQARIDL